MLSTLEAELSCFLYHNKVTFATSLLYYQFIDANRGFCFCWILLELFDSLEHWADNLCIDFIPLVS